MSMSLILVIKLWLAVTGGLAFLGSVWLGLYFRSVIITNRRQAAAHRAAVEPLYRPKWRNEK